MINILNVVIHSALQNDQVSSWVDFFYKWQTLVGSFLGPFIAIIISTIAFLFKSKYENKKEHREALRRIEIGITRSLEDTYKNRQKIEFFESSLKKLIEEIRKINDNKHFSLDIVNFPAIRDIYRDQDLPNFKVYNYYLHNKILWVDAGIHETNKTLETFKEDFFELQRKNELHITLERQNPSPSPQRVRDQYVSNLEAFLKAVETFKKGFVAEGIKMMIQVKVFNQYLGKSDNVFLRKFKDKKVFPKNLNSVDEIDKILNDEVEKILKDAEERMAQIHQSL